MQGARVHQWFHSERERALSCLVAPYYGMNDIRRPSSDTSTLFLGFLILKIGKPTTLYSSKTIHLRHSVTPLENRIVNILYAVLYVLC